MAARRRGPSARPDAALFVDLAFVLALIGVATFAAWPVYQTWYLLITVGGGVLIAAGAVLLGRMRQWSWPFVAFTVAGAYIVLGVPLAVPRAFASRADFMANYRDLIVATVGDWKKLITVQPPVGHYQTLLVPMFITILVCATAAFSIVFNRVRSYGVLVPIMLVPIAVAIAFGTTSNGSDWQLAGFAIAAGRHTAVGVLALGLSGGFLVWRGQHARTVALREAAAASGIRRAGGTAAGAVRRIAGAVAVALVGLLVAVPLSSAALVPSSRHVLRSAVEPSAQLRQYVSPLTAYRNAFTSDPDDYNAPLLSYTGDAAQLGRLRVATMSFYDGQQYTVLPNDSDRTDAFTRVPQLTSTTHQGGLASLTVTIDKAYGTVIDPDVWMPTVDGLQAVGFHGDDVNSLTDGFYFNGKLQAGAELDRLAAGDSYTLLATPAGAAAPLASLSPPQGAVPATAGIPDSLTQWVQAQDAGSGGPALAELISRLRQRGLLSHSLEQPAAGTKAHPSWLDDIGGAADPGLFTPSYAGESVDRIDDLFTALLRRQQQVGAKAAPAALVAAAGDDEQFAVASALIAESLGFPARVVLGFDLAGDQGDPAALPACTGGVCRGKNLTAWVEVQGADGTWVPVDVTPQHKLPISKQVVNTRVPELPTQVQHQDATVQPPPEANPSGAGRQDSAKASANRSGPGAWVPVARVGGSIVLVLLVLLAPLVSLAVVKGARRRERRGAATSAARMAGGWDELVDTAIDFGLPAPGVRTRAEAAAVYASAARSADSTRLHTLASSADEAIFGAFDPTPEAAEQFWAQLDEQRTRLAAGFPRWKRLLALISLRSFRSGGGGGA